MEKQRSWNSFADFSLEPMAHHIVDWAEKKHVNDVFMSCKTWKHDSLIWAAITIHLRGLTWTSATGPGPKRQAYELVLETKACVTDNDAPTPRPWPGTQSADEDRRIVQRLSPVLKRVRKLKIVEHRRKDVNFLLHWYHCPVIRLFFGALAWPHLEKCTIGFPFLAGDVHIPQKLCSWVLRLPKLEEFQITCLPESVTGSTTHTRLQTTLKSMRLLRRLKAPVPVMIALAKTESRLVHWTCDGHHPFILHQLAQFELGNLNLRFLEFTPGTVVLIHGLLRQVFAAFPHIERLRNLGLYWHQLVSQAIPHIIYS